MWRLQTHDTFGGTWLSDYIDNRLGHEPAQEAPGKPDCPLIGQDGNIFNLVGIASRTLKAHGMPEQAKEMADRVFSCDSYHKALCIIGEYVNISIWSLGGKKCRFHVRPCGSMVQRRWPPPGI